MTEAEVREAISQAFGVAWTAARPDIPLVLENEALLSVDSFVALTIQLTTGTQRTTGRRGTRRTQRNGWIQVKLWTLANRGTAAIAGLADSVRGILEMTSFGAATPDAVTTQAASSMPIGTDGHWAMSLVRVPFWYVETT